MIEERDGSGTLIAEYAYGNGIDEPIVMRRLDTADVDGDSNTTEWMEYFYHQNGANNVTFITLGNCSYATRSAGDVIEKYEYDLYGATTKLTWWDPAANGGNGAFADKTANGTQIANLYLFQGRRYDPESKLYYFRNRYYDPAAGRFISRDPAGFVDGPNLYAFVNNNPINFTDPMGLEVTVTKKRRYTDKEANAQAEAIAKANFTDKLVEAMWWAHEEGSGFLNLGTSYPWRERYQQMKGDLLGANAALRAGEKLARTFGFDGVGDKAQALILSQAKMSRLLDKESASIMADYRNSEGFKTIRRAFIERMLEYPMSRYDYTISADINIYGDVSKDPRIPRRTGAQIEQEWQNAINTRWNKAGGTHDIDGHLVRFKVKVNYTLEEDGDAQNNVEIITLDPPATWHRSNVLRMNYLLWSTANSGQWWIDAPGGVIAHEFGHLGFMLDYYKDVTVGGVLRSVTIPGRGYSLMGASGRTRAHARDVKELFEENK